jgi:two-component system phosphate regulon sensor histidine kinase PhoR
MREPVIHVSFDLIGAAIILLVLLLIVTGLVLLTSWYWRRWLARSSMVGQWEALLDSLPMGLLLADQEGQVLWCNPEVCQLLSLDRVSPRPFDELRTPLARDLVSLVKRVAESHQSELHEVQPAADVRLQLRAMPLGGSSPPEGGVICMVTDVSERRHQEEFYRNFIQNISHELLTPLAAIAGHVANIKECSIEEVESWRRSQDIIEREVRRLTGLTSNLLLLSRLESGVPLRLEPTNIGVVVEEAVAGLLRVAQAKAIELSIQSPPRLPRIRADRHRIKQVFINLLDNAVKYCPGGSEVQVRLETDGESIIVEVADNGPGIPPEDLPHIFGKMYRVEKERTRAVEGSGLGLSIVKRIVELHGGQIAVESTVGKGTKFGVRLPLVETRPS